MTEYNLKSKKHRVKSPILHTSFVFCSILFGNGELLLDSALQVLLFFR